MPHSRLSSGRMPAVHYSLRRPQASADGGRLAWWIRRARTPPTARAADERHAAGALRERGDNRALLSRAICAPHVMGWRMLALTSARTAVRLGLAPVSLTRWLVRRELPRRCLRITGGGPRLTSGCVTADVLTQTTR